jgi:hypothetical protein
MISAVGLRTDPPILQNNRFGEPQQTDLMAELPGFSPMNLASRAPGRIT